MKKLDIGDPAHTTVQTSTSRDLTYYVSATGDDSKNGLSPGNAFLTIQAAFDLLPEVIRHNILISIGEGTFDPAALADKEITGEGSLVIRGTLGAPTLTTGNTSGTYFYTSSTNDTVVPFVADNWTVDELRGMLLKVAATGKGDVYQVICSNQANSIFIGNANQFKFSNTNPFNI